MPRGRRKLTLTPEEQEQRVQARRASQARQREKHYSKPENFSGHDVTHVADEDYATSLQGRYILHLPKNAYIRGFFEKNL